MAAYNPTPEERQAREEHQNELMREIMLQEREISWSPTPLPECFVRATYYSCLHVKERAIARSEICPHCPPDEAVFRDSMAQGCDPPAQSREVLDWPCPSCEINWNPVQPGTEAMERFEKDTPPDEIVGVPELSFDDVDSGDTDVLEDGDGEGREQSERRSLSSSHSYERLRPEESSANGEGAGGEEEH